MSGHHIGMSEGTWLFGCRIVATTSVLVSCVRWLQRMTAPQICCSSPDTKQGTCSA